MKFHTALGGAKAIADYVSPMLDWAVSMLCEALEVKPYVLPKTMQAPLLRVIGKFSILKLLQSNPWFTTS